MLRKLKAVKIIIGVILIYICALLIASFIKSDLRSTTLHSKNYLLFIKTHKTGSSTAINLFQRFAFLNNLTVALPRNDDVFLGWPRLLTNILDVTLSLPNNSTKFNYVINHIIYRTDLIPSLFPAEPVKVTLVREPVQQIRSSFNYYNILHEEGDTTTSVVKRMELFFSDPVRFDSSYYMDNWFVKSRTRNPQLADLGLPYDKMNNMTLIDQHVSMIISDFNLIMVADMMDESLVLLKRLMRWQLIDILYEKKYSLPYIGKDEIISEELESKINSWVLGDNLLYWKAKEVLFRLMANEKNFKEELLNFREINMQVESYCRSFDDKHELVVPETPWNTELTINISFCKNYLRKERPFTRLLQSKQRPDLFDKAYYEEIEDSKLLVNIVS